MGPIFDDNDRRRHRLFNGPQIDPTHEAAKRGVPYFRAGHGRVLMPDSFMPVGQHAGKHLRAVPVAYLRWVNAQPWAAQWRPWQPVADYLTRFPVPEANAEVCPPIIFVDTLTPCVPTKAWRWPSCCHLHCLPGHEDKLHAFALGALGLERRWYQQPRGSMPHYDLNEAKQELALGHGAELVDRQQMVEHLRRWREAGGAVAPFVRVREDGTQTCTKHCYGSLKEAQTVINERLAGKNRGSSLKNYGALPRRYRHNTPDFLRAYLCPKCGFHHITSQP